jgi:hypothetical protein
MHDGRKGAELSDEQLGRVVVISDALMDPAGGRPASLGTFNEIKRW